MAPRAAGTVLDRPTAPASHPRSPVIPAPATRPTRPTRSAAGTVPPHPVAGLAPGDHASGRRTPAPALTLHDATGPDPALTTPRHHAARPDPEACGCGPAPGGPPADHGSAASRGEAVLAVHWFLTACLEVINGYRPVSHLRCLVGPDQIDPLLAGLARRAPERTCPAAPSRMRDAERIRLRRARVCQVSPATTETAAVFGCAEASWAVAIRMERVDGRWRCTLAQPVG